MILSIFISQKKKKSNEIRIICLIKIRFVPFEHGESNCVHKMNNPCRPERIIVRIQRQSVHKRLGVEPGSIATTVSLTSRAFRNVIRFRYGTRSGLSVFNDRADRYAYTPSCSPFVFTVHGHN